MTAKCPRKQLISWLLLATAAGAACSTRATSPNGAADANVSDATTPADSGIVESDAANVPDGSVNDELAERGYGLNVPTGYVPTTPTPLVIMLHGYSADGPSEENYYFNLAAMSEAKTFLYAYPNGTMGTVSWSAGYRFWNATDACCDFFHLNPNDVAFFDMLVDKIASEYNVDSKRIFVVGHSNGGFMAHRLACDRSSRLAAIVSVAGAQWLDPDKCQPEEPVSAVEMHGDHDEVSANTQYPIEFDGGSTSEGQYPSAHATVLTWAQKNGCTGTLEDTQKGLDLEPSLPGAETRVETYNGCPSGIDVQLWTIQGGGHMDPLNTAAFGAAMWEFMSAHAKP